jgi:hypothetical protein
MSDRYDFRDFNTRIHIVLLLLGRFAIDNSAEKIFPRSSNQPALIASLGFDRKFFFIGSKVTCQEL